MHTFLGKRASDVAAKRRPLVEPLVRSGLVGAAQHTLILVGQAPPYHLISVGYNLIVLSRDAASHSWLSLLLIIGWFSYMPLCFGISSPAISCFIFFISSGPVS